MSTQPKIFVFSAETWARKSADLIHKSLKRCLEENNKCSVMLTGGRSAERLYSSWAEIEGFENIRSVDFFFGDERCVPPTHPESNYGMVRRTLFERGVPPGCTLSRMEGERPDPKVAAEDYAETIPDGIDILLLGVGEDGHIASLFPQSHVLQELGKKVVPVIGLKKPYKRLTVTPRVIKQASEIFILASGKLKAAVLSQAMRNPNDIFSYPVRIVLNATWVLEENY